MFCNQVRKLRYHPVRAMRNLLRLLVVAFTYLMGSFFSEAAFAQYTEPLMVYEKQEITSVPKYRIWNASSWGSAQDFPEIQGELTQIRMAASSTRNEVIAVTFGSTGYIQAWVWNGSTWAEGFSQQIFEYEHTDGIGNGSDVLPLYAGIGVAYETNSDEALVVYVDGDSDPSYYTWSGTTWTGPSSMTIPNTSVQARARYIELARDPLSSSNEIAFMMLDDLIDCYGARWTGSGWDYMGVTGAMWDTDTGQANDRGSIAVTYETSTGDALWVWPDNDTATRGFNYRLWDSSAGTLGAITKVTITSAGDTSSIIRWSVLRANPANNTIMYISTDGAADLVTVSWNGSTDSWNADQTEHSTGVESISEQCFDFVWNSAGTSGWLFFGNGTALTRREWTTSWQTATTNLADDTMFVVAARHPIQGYMHVVTMDDGDSTADGIRETTYVSGWSTITADSIWAGPTVRNRQSMPIGLVGQRHSSNTLSIMVYDVQNITHTARYREWGGSSWGTEGTVGDVTGAIRHMVMKIAPTRDEAMVGILTSVGNVYSSRWNGSSWSTPELRFSGMADVDGLADTRTIYRGIDLDYERISGDCIFVYGDNSADPNYNTWNGSTWVGEGDIDLPSTGRPRTIEVANSFQSDQIAYIHVDSDTDAVGARWTGSSWDMMSQVAAWDTGTTAAFGGHVDAAFEALTDDIMYVWGEATNAIVNYRTYSGGSLAVLATLNHTLWAGQLRWTVLGSNPYTDEIMLVGVDSGSDVNTREWSGTAWDSQTPHTEHTATLEDIVDRGIDVIYERRASRSGRAWIVYNTGTVAAFKEWSGTGWGTAQTLGDDTASADLEADGTTGNIFALLYEDNSSASENFNSTQLTDEITTWPALNVIWNGPTTRNTGYLSYVLATQPLSAEMRLSGYRLFANANSADVGSPLAAQDTPADTPGANVPFRLRFLMQLKGTSLATSQREWKLQYAAKSGTCDTAYVGESYADITAATSPIRYYDNGAVGDDIALTTNANDPVLAGGYTHEAQTYNEANNFTNSQTQLLVDEVAIFDAALVDTGSSPGTSYCLRVVRASDNAVLSNSTVVMEVNSPGGLSVDIVDSGGTPVGSPNVSLAAAPQGFTCQEVTGTLGVSAQKLRLTNDTGNGSWSLSIAASAPTDRWTATGPVYYDFNDGSGTPAGCSDGGDTDGSAGQLTLNPTTATITPEVGCTSTNLSLGSLASFAEGTLNSIELVSAASGDTSCYWDVTGIGVSQRIPVESSPGSYALDLTMTITAQ